MSNNYVVSVKRTVAQAGAAWVVAQAARAGVELPGDAISDALFAVMFALYYALYRLLEQRFPDALALLGSSLQPVYVGNENDVREHDDADE